MPTAAELVTRIAVEGADQYARDMGKAETVTDKTAKNMDDAGKKAGGLGSALGGVASIASGFVVAQGITQLGGYLQEAVKGAADDEAATKRLQQAVKNLGGDYEATLKSVDDAITKGQKLAFTDDEIRDSYQSLAAATGNNTEAHKRLAAAQDLARGANIPLATATKMLGKINGENVEVFRKMGIVLGDNATEADALAAVQQKFGGQAETYAKSTAGQFEQSKIAMAEFQEMIGGAILPIVTKLIGVAGKLGPPVAEFAEKLIGIASARVGPTLENIAGQFEKIGSFVGGTLAPAIRGVFELFSTGFSNTAFESLQKLFGPEQNAQIMAFISGIQNVRTAIGGIVELFRTGFSNTAFDALNNLFGPEKAVKIIETVQNIRAAVVQAFSGIAEEVRPTLDAIVGHVQRIVQEIGERWSQILPVILPIITHLQVVITEGLNIISNAFQLVMNIIQGDWQEAWNNIKEIAGSDWTIIQSAVENGVKALLALLELSWGLLKDLTQAAWDGIVALMPIAWEGIKAGVQAGIDAIPGILQAGMDAYKALLQAEWDFIKTTLIPGAWEGIKIAVQFGIDAIPPILRAGMDLAKTALQEAWDFVKDTLIPLAWEGIKTGVSAGINEVVELLKGMKQLILTGLSDIGTWLVDVGRSLIQGIIDGGWTVDLFGALKDIVTNGIQGAWEAIRPGSPSEEGADIGRNFITGIIFGAGELAGALKDYLVKLAKDAVSSIPGAIAGAAGDIAGAIGGIISGGGSSGSGLYTATSSGSNVELGRQMAAGYGWTGAEFDALNRLWTQESGWRTDARNPTSGAAGIPQALGHALPPGYATDPSVQIAWGLDYIRGRYGSPSAALAFEQRNGWYGTGGKIKSGWFGVGERGFEVGHMGPDGLTIFPHEMSKALLPMTGGRGYAGGTVGGNFGAIPGGPGGNDIEAAKRVAYITGYQTSETQAAWFAGWQTASEYVAALNEMFFEQMRQLEQVRLGDEIKKFVEWVRQFGEEWLKQLLETEGPQAAFQAFHGRSSRSLDPAQAQAQAQGPITVVLNVDGRQFARATTPAVSAQMAAQVSSTMGGY